MSLPRTVTHEFVEFVPAEREPGRLYVSIPYKTVVHDCLCGCGMKVVTPIRRDKWVLTFDGETISLSPSVGNWSFPCQSHYFIRGNRVIAARPMDRDAISRGRARDAALTESYLSPPVISGAATHEPTQAKPKRGFWARLFSGR